MGNRINDAIQKVRTKEGITYREISDRCGISEQTLHSTRKRKHIGRIGIDVLMKIAHGLGMTAEELYYGEEIERPSMSADEQHMLDVYRATDSRGKANIDRAVEVEADYMDETAKGEARDA